MPEAAASRDVPHLEMIEELVRCAFELGKAATEIARRAGNDIRLFLRASDEFRHCFFSVRMGIRLAQAERAGRLVARAASEPLERERAEAVDPLERERGERLEALEREREGDYEPVSLPQFLKTLRGVATRAEQRADDLPVHVRDTTLPTLRALLDRAETPTPPSGGNVAGVALLTRRPPPPPARSRLLGSTGGVHIPLRRPTDSS